MLTDPVDTWLIYRLTLDQMWLEYWSSASQYVSCYLTDTHIGQHINQHPTDTHPILKWHSINCQLMYQLPCFAWHSADTSLILGQHIDWVPADMSVYSVDRHFLLLWFATSPNCHLHHFIKALCKCNSLPVMITIWTVFTDVWKWSPSSENFI